MPFGTRVKEASTSDSRAMAWDYIVVGAGHNGLSAGCTLAKAGRSVLILEQLPVIGGLSASLPYVEAAPKHLLSLGAMDDMLMASTSLADELRLAEHGYVHIRLEHPYGWMNEDGDTLLLFSDFERTVEEIRYFSPKDAQTYRQIRRTLDWLMDLRDRFAVQHPSAMGKLDLATLAMKLAVDKDIRSIIAKMFTMNIFDLLSETFECDATQGLWAYWTSMMGPADLDGSGLYLVGFANVHRRGGVLRPRGGMSALMNALASCLKHHGGEIRVGTEVERILVDHGTAKGVRVANGMELSARKGVLANCAPQVTLGKLLDEGVLDRNMRNRVRMIPANAINSAAFKIDVAVGGPLTYPKAQAKRKQRDGVDVRRTTFMTGTLQDHIDQMQALKLGLNVPTPPVYMAILSATDDTIAPPGQDVFYLHSNVPVTPVGGWPDRKGTYVESIMTSAKRFVHGLDAEIGRVESSPLDFETRFNTPRGSFFHVDMTPMRMGMYRPAPGLGGFSTPVARLYIAGAGVHPGGGVSGWPGRLAAQHAMRLER